MDKKTTIIDLGINLKEKNGERPKLYVMTLKGISVHGVVLMNAVSVAYNLEEAIEKSKVIADRSAQEQTIDFSGITWKMDSHLMFTTEKLISLFYEFKNNDKNPSS